MTYNIHKLVISGCDIAHEFYLAILVDRENKSVLIMASTEGGMDIEEVAEATPELIGSKPRLTCCKVLLSLLNKPNAFPDFASY